MEESPPRIECLPPEILAHVFHFLDHPAPSDTQLHDQPHGDMLRRPQDENTLKSISHVNKRWRHVVLPLLFRNVVWYLDRFNLMRVEERCAKIAGGPAAAIAVLPFLRDNNLTPYVQSFTLTVWSDSDNKSRSGSRSSSSSAASSNDVGLYRRGDGSGHYGYLHTPLSPPIGVGGRGGGISATRDLVFNEDTNWLWKLLFDVIDPLRFTIVASPCILASLLARMLFLGDAWCFDQSHHILSLSRPADSRRRPSRRNTGIAASTTDANQISQLPSTSSPPRPSSSNSTLIRPTKRIPCTLFTVLPWTALLLNEGSSTRVYKTYEYFHMRPPSMLGALLGAEEFPNDVSLIPQNGTITDFSYVGIFPLSSHVHTLIQNLPPLRRLYVQLVPRNDILDDTKEMERLDRNDLWAERDAAYDHLVRQLMYAGEEEVDEHGISENWRHLQEFETGDSVDSDNWRTCLARMAHGLGRWRPGGREGLLVRREESTVQTTLWDF